MKSDNKLIKVRNTIYEQAALHLSSFEKEIEGRTYAACRYKINDWNIVCRDAKITPKKVGQFVTFWKRNAAKVTRPFDENDAVDFFVINVYKENRVGQFVFPKSILIKKGIISTTKKDGKRGFRVYPIWDKTTSKQAQKTQKWQLDFFVEMNKDTKPTSLKTLYKDR